MSIGTKKALRPTYSEVNGKVLILSIDDEPTNHMVVNEIIRSQGYLLHEVRPLLSDWPPAFKHLGSPLFLERSLHSATEHTSQQMQLGSKQMSLF